MTVWLDRHPRRIFSLLGIVCLCMLAFGQYLQHALGVEPCPMCIVQRYAVIAVGIFAVAGAVGRQRRVHLTAAALLLCSAGFGAYVAARQSWLQWYPPEFQSCGRDFYGMIESFPLQRAIPMIFKGSGDCSKVDWSFLGGSLANWSFVFFVAFALLALGLIVCQAKSRQV